MNPYHDPIRQENYLRQCLAHDKKPLGLFLGAGAPMAIKVVSEGDHSNPLIPDISEMTRQVCSTMLEGSLNPSFKLVDSHFKEDGKSNPNIEDILTHIRSLQKVAGNGEVRGLNFIDLSKLDVEICNAINNIVDKKLPNYDSPYHKVAEWIRAIPRTHSVEIYTTNYDLLMEQALEELQIPFFDGFVGSRYTFFDPYTIEDDQLPARWARIWKIHGSINWNLDDNGLVYRSMFSPNPNGRRVIHPSHLKYDESRKMPFLAMTDRLKSFIKKPSSLMITCGYSFNDQHLNDVMAQGLTGNPTAIIFAFLYGELENYPQAIELATKISNLSVFAEDRGIIGAKTAPWIERNKDEIGTESFAVSWVTEDGCDISRAKFKLGDFQNLGDFITDIIGMNKEGDKGK